jgi:ABC-type branched-subunit amino acid transport system substrate-binding protein
VAADTKQSIKLGMSNALTGPASDLGQALRHGSQLYFDRVNDAGGIYGRKVELISLDDGYEPELTVINTRKLIEQDDVFALFGYVGTPTSHSILSMLDKSQIPYLMPLTGADFLREPIKPNIYNLRASYQQEVSAQIDYLINHKHLKNIALVIQADEFGLVAQKAINTELSLHNIEPVAYARYKRNTHDMSHVLKKLQAQPIEAVIFVGTYEPFSQLINLSYQKNMDLLFTSLSFISSHKLFSLLQHNSRVIITEIVPDPYQCQWAVCKMFRSDMKKNHVKYFNRVQLEGYLNAFVFTEVAKLCQLNLTRSCLLEKFETFSLNESNLSITFSQINHQGLQNTYLSYSPNFTRTDNNVSAVKH